MKIIKVIFNIIIGLLFIILILFCLKYYKHENEMFYIPNTTNTTNTFVNNTSSTYIPTTTSIFINNTLPITTTTTNTPTTTNTTTTTNTPTTTNTDSSTFFYTTPTSTNTSVTDTPIDRTKLYGKLELDTDAINKMSNPDIEYDTKRIELNRYSDILL